jgi:hypothetical protein
MYSVDSFSGGQDLITSYIGEVGLRVYEYRGHAIAKASYSGVRTFFHCSPCEIFCGHCGAGAGFGLYFSCQSFNQCSIFTHLPPRMWKICPLEAAFPHSGMFSAHHESEEEYIRVCVFVCLCGQLALRSFESKMRHF